MHYKGKPTLLFCFGIAPRLPTAAAAPSLVSAASAPLVQLPPSSRQLRVVGQTRSHTPAPRIGASLHPTLPMYVCSSEICRNQDHVFAYLSPRVNGSTVEVFYWQTKTGSRMRKGHPMPRRHRDNARSPITNKNFMSFLFCHRNEHIIHLNSNLFELYKNKLNEKASDILTKGGLPSANT